MKSVIYFLIIITCACTSFWYIDLKSEELGREIDQSSVKAMYQNPERIIQAVRLDGLKANDVIDSPIVIQGEVSGKWFFEGVINVKVLDGAGIVLGRGPLNAEGDWMVEKNVRFSGPLPFMDSKTKRGCIVIEADDPSGLGRIKPYELPIIFKDTIIDCDMGDCGTDNTTLATDSDTKVCPHHNLEDSVDSH
jgi:hypothetical protein